MTPDSVQATSAEPQIRSVDDAVADTRRGGDVRTLLSPKSVGSTSGFMGVATIAPGDRISEHYHPYSEEFIYVVSGRLDAQLDGKSHSVRARQGFMIPINVRHRLVNNGDEEVFIVFHLGPLAPRPDLGHVDTE
jgi:putative monooxygenase